jgi:hypothetical protein
VHSILTTTQLQWGCWVYSPIWSVSHQWEDSQCDDSYISKLNPSYPQWFARNGQSDQEYGFGYLHIIICLIISLWSCIVNIWRLLLLSRCFFNIDTMLQHYQSILHRYCWSYSWPTVWGCHTEKGSCSHCIEVSGHQLWHSLVGHDEWCKTVWCLLISLPPVCTL